MKDNDDLKGALEALEEDAKEFCKEKGLDPEKAVFTLELFYNLLRIEPYWIMTGIRGLIETFEENIAIEEIDSEAMIFYIDDEPGLSERERKEGEEHIEGKKLYTGKTDTEEAREWHTNRFQGEKFIHAQYLEADVHVRICLFDSASRWFAWV